jgi:SAM-dependent methyltransferase
MADSGDGILHRLRAAEIESALPWFPPHSRVLELGGADGFQASLIRESGHDVSAIDVAGRPRTQVSFHPVEDYDGFRIPFDDGTFDVVFSSNVLEHIPHLPDTLAETRRVLRPGGVGVHLVPSATWRLWTTAAHYPWLVTYALRGGRSTDARIPPLGEAVARSRTLDLAMKALGLAAHGEYSSAITELYYFRRARWRRFLLQQGFEVVHAGSNHLFYTGYALLAELSIPLRRRLSSVIGGSCHLIVVRSKRLPKTRTLRA